MNGRGEDAARPGFVCGAGWHEVGDPQDPDRRPHSVFLGSIRVPVTNKSEERLFLRNSDVREALASGTYAISFRAMGHVLRHPDDVLSSDAAALDEIAYGLRREEAAVVAASLGARLAEEKEVELVWRFRSKAFAALPSGAALWTASEYEPFAYAHCGYDLAERRWYSDETVRPRTMRKLGEASTFLIEGGRLSRRPRNIADVGNPRIAAPILFVNAETA